MPVVYELDHARDRIHTRCLGPVTLEEGMGHFAQLCGDPACPEALGAIVAPDDAMFGMSRMFEVFAEKHFDAIDRSAP